MPLADVCECKPIACLRTVIIAVIVDSAKQPVQADMSSSVRFLTFARHWYGWGGGAFMSASVLILSSPCLVSTRRSFGIRRRLRISSEILYSVSQLCPLACHTEPVFTVYTRLFFRHRLQLVGRHRRPG